MFKTAATVGIAALVAGFVAFVGPNVQAGTPKADMIGPQSETAVPATVATTEAKIPAADCAQRAWPYNGQDCLTGFAARWNGEPRKVRVVTADRVR